MAIIDGMKTTCLIDNGARVNLVTLEFVKNRGLEVGSIQDLNNHNGYIPLSGLGGKIPPDALKAFEELKLRCMTVHVLVFTDFKKPFQLETDASKEGLGAVLLQESDDG